MANASVPQSQSRCARVPRQSPLNGAAGTRPRLEEPSGQGACRAVAGTSLWSRRCFLRSAAAGALAPLAIPGLTVPDRADSGGRAEPRWFEHAWRRAVIDMHIPDWDPEFLSRFDPDDYVRALVTSRAESIVLYAHSHVGLFNYPTAVGQQHQGLKGRDIVAELIERCHDRDIACVLYVSVIHDRWASDRHPDWRVIHPNGGEFGPGSRHGFVCPNSPYREYVRDWTREIAERFDLDGMRFDMTFWTCVCHCRHCQERWADEVGGEMPRVVDWTDERWVALQRRRESWLGEFAALCTETVKAIKPRATVEHQASTFPASWNNGVASDLVPQNDFLQGDFYGDALQGSFVRKLLASLTPNRPAGFETSFSVSLQDHTARKSEALLQAKASAAIADAAAFIFIDAIDPVGTVNPHAHERMGRVFDRLMPYYAELGGERVMDVGVYYSLESKFDMRQNGRSVVEVDNGADTHTRSSMQAPRWLISNHIPFGVVTRRNLGQLSRLKTLLLCNVHHMDETEVAAIREWVRAGGALYASAGSSLVNTRGQKQADFMLADALGVSLETASWADFDHYLAPTPAGLDLFPGWDTQYPAFIPGPGFGVRPRPGASPLALRTLPWPAPERRAFSSIHSNPPWVSTQQAEVVLHQFGQGTCLYSASPIEDHETLAESFIRLVRRLTGPLTLEIDTHPSVEATLFSQADRRRHVLALVSFQKELPNLPVEEIRVRLRAARRVRQVDLLPDGPALRFAEGEAGVEFVLPRLDTLALVALAHD